MSKKTQDHQISVFENAVSTNKNTLTINDYFQGIITGKWQDEVLNYRAERTTKQKIPAVTASGLFTGRKDSELQEHSGLIAIDIDEKDQTKPITEIREQLKEIPELFALHYSLGGKGLAAYFRINKAKHFESFEAITKMLVNDYGIVPDMHCSNIGRLRFVSYDPECHLNFGASVWNYFESKENRISNNEVKYSNVIFSEHDINYILGQIKDRHLNIAPDYYSWLRIGFGLADKLGDQGRDVFNLISSYYSGKQKIDSDKQYDRCLKAGKSGITIKTFFYYAKQAGCNLTSERSKKIITIGKLRRKQEQSSGSGAIVNGRSDARQYLEDFEGISGKDVDDILEQVWRAPASELASEEGVLYDIELFLKSNYKFRLNEITQKIEVNDNAMNDYLFNSIYLKCKKVVEKSNKDVVYDLLNSDFTMVYNPILEWFEKNKHIQTTGNIAKLASCIQSDINLKDAKFIEYFLEKWLISIVASAHGIYSILCLVLTGQEHGTGKSNFFRRLLPENLRWAFATDTLDGSNKDIGIMMSSKLIIMDDEFGGKSKADERKFKGLTSTEIISMRPPYGRYIDDKIRVAVLCGTTNEEKVLNDLSGNRRIIPIQVNLIDQRIYDEVDKTELFVELYHKFRANPQGWFINHEDIIRLKEVCGEANQVSAEMELPLKYFGKSTKSNPAAVFMSSSEMRSIMEKNSGIRLSQQKISIALKNIGYDYDVKRINGILCRGFWVIDRTNSSTTPYEDDEKTIDKLPF